MVLVDDLVRIFDVLVSGIEDDRNVGGSPAKVLAHPKTVVRRHSHVEDHAARVVVDGANALEAVRTNLDLVPVLENGFERGSDELVVVDHHHDRAIARVALVAANHLLEIFQRHVPL
jgi:hypothetical protein